MDEIKERLGKAQAEIVELLLSRAKDKNTILISGDREVTQMLCDISNTISNACRAIGELYAEAKIYEGVLCETEEIEVNVDDAPEETKPAGTAEADVHPNG